MRLGPFELIEIIGRGGMGEVWRGRHVAGGVGVAVKVVRVAPHDSDRFAQAFRNEVRAVAALDHPGIIAVFDQGVVPDDGTSTGRLRPGSPYLVMELANLGSLDSLRRRLTWSEIRFVLLGLLDALAYAHGAGLIHRDIKPANVLFSGPDDLRPGIKLTDFGLAHTYEYQGEVSPSDARSGTPVYMAPEQFHGQWRDYGPWTDLYALGCLGWELATGEPPFAGASFVELARAQIQDPLPQFTAGMSLPQGFYHWLARCLAKAGEQRFQRAADAAHALAGLPASALSQEDAAAFAAEFGGDITHEGWGQATTVHLPEETTLPAVGPPARLDWEIVCPPPVPPDWRRHRPTAPAAVIGAGLNMFGVRKLKLVDRETERDLLWSRLLEAVDRGRPHAVVLHGPEGFGKARLAEWICRRADEVGWALALRVTHSPEATPHDGLGMMVARYLRCEGLTGDLLLARAETIARRIELTEPYAWISLAQLISRPANTSLHSTRDTQTERFATLLRLIRELRRSGRFRPLVLRAENVQWGHEAIAFAFWMLMRAPDIPMLLVLTTTDLRAPGIPELLGMDGAEALAVGPLPHADHVALVRDVMGLEQRLATRVATQTAGSPLFARQLVGHFIERGVLDPSPGGFVLRAGVSTSLPDDMHAVWMARVTIAVTAQRVPLVERAAVLGGTISMSEWAAACSDDDGCAQILEHLLRAGLALATEGGFELAHSNLRESLLLSASESGRLSAHHVACAGMLSDHCGPHDAHARIGRHLAAAKRGAEAADHLLKGATAATAAGSFDDALALLALIDRGTVTTAQLTATCVAQARVHRYRAEFQEAEGALRDTGPLHALPPRLRAQVELERAKLALLTGEQSRAMALLDGMEDLPREDPLRGYALRLRATIELIRGELAQARAHVTESAEVLELSDPADRIESLLLLGYLFLTEGDINEALTLFDRCLEWYRLTGNTLMRSVALNHRGDALRRAADLDGAERDYRAALELAEPLGASHAAVARANLALVCLARQQYAMAGRYAAEVFEDGNGTAELTVTLHLVLAACAASRGDVAEYLHRLDATEAQIGVAPSIIYDVAWPAEAAGAAAAAAGRPDLARRAYLLAQRLWTQAHHTDDAERIGKVLASLTARA